LSQQMATAVDVVVVVVVVVFSRGKHVVLNGRRARLY
jgi:hypothetical protein